MCSPGMRHRFDLASREFLSPESRASRMSTISVVVPTLNCLELLRTHVEFMRSWMHLAHEIVVVDSFSEDGCADFARDAISHPRLRVLSHPRGLYQSWNHGIRQSTGDWIYVSTVGDSITADHLERLRGAAERLEVDVVVSPPRFVGPDGASQGSRNWPLERYLKDFPVRRDAHVLSPSAALILSLRAFPMSILGSSASNLYRGTTLRAHPFPSEFGLRGDVGWGLRNQGALRIGVVPDSGSTFLLHPKAYGPTPATRKPEIFAGLLKEARALLEEPNRSRLGKDARLLCERAADFLAVTERWWLSRESLRKSADRDGHPWWKTGEGWVLRPRKIYLNWLLSHSRRRLDGFLRRELRAAGGA